MAIAISSIMERKLQKRNFRQALERYQQAEKFVSYNEIEKQQYFGIYLMFWLFRESQKNSTTFEN
ncbi:hypothetical protein FM036_47070 [Nostoc sp. HG1]|nr:hypothetical protein [Nostoc sp. HG1]